MTIRIFALVFIVSIFPTFLLNAAEQSSQTAAEEPMKLESPAFEEGAAIPIRHTCRGNDVSPPLEWRGVPKEAVALALIVDDPDAPGKPWSHWVLFNLPAHIQNIPESIPRIKSLANGELQGKNDFKKIGYGGPCPPFGKHRYHFKLYALDIKLKLPASSSKKEVEEAMKGHILAQTQLMGTYENAKP